MAEEMGVRSAHTVALCTRRVMVVLLSPHSLGYVKPPLTYRQSIPPRAAPTVLSI